MANTSEDNNSGDQQQYNIKKKVSFLGRKKTTMSSSTSDEDNDDHRHQIKLSSNYSRNSSVASANVNPQQTTHPVVVQSKRHRRKSKKNSNWEVVEGYRDNNMKIMKPENYEGFLLKRRNWPMKGWHKRYFTLNEGILKYYKSKSDIQRNKIHGTVNAYLSIVSYMKSSRRILIDSSTQSSAIVCHLKAKTQSEFDAWLDHIKKHRVYHQYRYSQPTTNSQQIPSSSNKIIKVINQPIDNESSSSNLDSNVFNFKSLKDSNLCVENVDLNLKNVEENLYNLSKLLNSLNSSSQQQQPQQQQQQPKTKSNHKRINSETTKIKISSKFKLNEYLSIPNNNKLHVSKSNPNLNNDAAILGPLKQTSGQQEPPLPQIQNQSSDEFRIKTTFYQAAKTIYDQLQSIHQQVSKNKERLIELSNSSNLIGAPGQLVSTRRSQSVLSSMSLQDSQLQFYDAIEYFTSYSESDEDSEESDGDGNGELANNTTISPSNRRHRQTTTVPTPENILTQTILNRRRQLPAAAPDASQISIWSILRKAIGKDLSKISLPVILNEPLSILQRLCEEIEYSDLIDTANSIQDPYDRMVYVTAFIISGYASSYYRNGTKNFNPLLGETYELIRPDKGWKYISEQVSHHPPISTSHCHSKSFIHEQVFHARIKFWGKTMEVHPEGYTRLTLSKFNETYQWNKITMYVYNVMGSPRRIEHCGEINVRCSNGVSSTIVFPKASQSRQNNEFYGDIIHENSVKRKVFGQWHDSFLCGTDNTAKTIWRMGAMPEDSHQYYGFTRFAIELNEFTDNLRDLLPRTDSRFRPDQRYLEEGIVEKAESEKQRIEEIQRDRRRIMETNKEVHKPLWFQNNDETGEWQINGNQYWSKRENPGFRDQIQHLW